MAPTERAYQAGFGNDFSSEAVAGALPRDQNTPQRPAFGLYVEELNGTAFTAPRGVSRSTWTYRIRPSAVHKPFRPIGKPARSGAARSTKSRRPRISCAGDRCRFPPSQPTSSMASSRSAAMATRRTQSGAAIHVYAANRPMTQPVLLQRRRRAADRSAVGRADAAHRAGRARRAARDSRPRAARHQVSRRAAGWIGARIHLRELRPAPAAARSRTDRHVRSGQRARLPGAGRGIRGSRGRLPRRGQVRRRSLGSRDRSLAARHRRVARQLRAVQVQTCIASSASTR